MKISTKGRYALRLMLDLALHEQSGYVPIKVIAERQDISDKYLEQIISILARAGFVKSVRGAGGGYKLAKTPEEYTVGMILRLTEGSLAPVACLEGEENTCPRQDSCSTLMVWKKLRKKMHNKKIRWTLLLSAALLAGCGKQIPKDVIHPDKMEDILYDYHLTTAMSGNISYDENYKKEALRNYVYRKHHVTKAEFDSSMVWYTRHTENLAKIYTNLGKRFREEKKDVKRLLAMRENKPSMSQPGDTVDVWYNKTLYWLTDAPLSNKITFEIPTDSNFKAKDAFLWSANYIFLSNLQQQVTMGFNILFDNDSVSGKVAEVTASGIQSLYIKPDSAYKIKSINGFIYLTGDSVKAPGIIVDKISLIRYHELADTVSIVAKDSVPEKSMSVIDKDTDSLKMDSVQMKEAVTPVRLNPRDMKEKEGIRPQRTRLQKK